jgi:hypothetical protein
MLRLPHWVRSTLPLRCGEQLRVDHFSGGWISIALPKLVPGGGRRQRLRRKTLVGKLYAADDRRGAGCDGWCRDTIF